ncbi:MAG: MFS transporter [Cyanobacteria bacterium]|nr:MFS transporter [Cyanobacteriota bacterium]
MKKFADKLNIINNQYYILFIIPLTKFIFGFYSGVIGSLLVPIGQAFNINLKIQSVIFPFNYFGQFATVFIAGFLADRFGKKPVQIICLVIFGFISLFYLKINNYYIMLILFFLMGIFGNSLNLMGDATISDNFIKNKGFYLNIAHGYFGLGAAIAPIAFNIVFPKTKDFRSIYLILFIIAFIIFLLIFLVKYPVVHNDNPKLSIILKILKNKDFILLCLYFALTLGTQFAISGWMPTLFQKNLNIDQKLSNYALSFFWFALVSGRILTAIACRKVKEITLIKIYNIIFLIVLAVSFFLNSYLLLLINYLLMGITIGGFVPLIIAYSSSTYKDYSSTRIGLIFAAGSLGSLIFPTVVGIAGDYFAIYKIIPFMSVFFIVYLFYFMKKRTV